MKAPRKALESARAVLEEYRPEVYTDRAQRVPYDKDQALIFPQYGLCAWLIRDLLHDRTELFREKIPQLRTGKKHLTSNTYKF